jgi:hypothetical protein
VVHVEEVEKVQHIMEVCPVTLDIFCTRCILTNQCTDDGEDGEKNEKCNRELERTKEIEKYLNEPLFLFADLNLRFFHGIILKKFFTFLALPGLYQYGSGLSADGERLGSN